MYILGILAIGKLSLATVMHELQATHVHGTNQHIAKKLIPFSPDNPPPPPQYLITQHLSHSKSTGFSQASIFCFTVSQSCMLYFQFFFVLLGEFDIDFYNPDH